MLSAMAYPALVLNADYRPIQTHPLKRMPWRRSVEAVLNDKFYAIANYDQEARSARMSIPIPSVVVSRTYIDLNRPAPLTRAGLFLRDGFRCQYCGVAGVDLTFDHVQPRSKGFGTSWHNILTACVPCNLAKADRTLAQMGWKPLREPYHPTRAQLNAIGARFIEPDDVVFDWREYLYWTVRLDP